MGNLDESAREKTFLDTTLIELRFFTMPIAAIEAFLHVLSAVINESEYHKVMGTP